VVKEGICHALWGGKNFAVFCGGERTISVLCGERETISCAVVREGLNIVLW